jgi:hypothetical protein
VLNRMIANPRTIAAFSDLAHRLTDDVRDTP